MESKEVVDKLNDLMHKNYDAEKSFRSVMDDIDDGKLKDLFAHQAQLHYNNNQELSTAIRTAGEVPSERSSVEGDTMRSWMNLKTTFSGNKEKTILEGLRKGEMAALEEYREVLEIKELPGPVKVLVLKQQETLQGIAEELRAWEETF